jgi:hypothetical protein
VRNPGSTKVLEPNQTIRLYRRSEVDGYAAFVNAFRAFLRAAAVFFSAAVLFLQLSVVQRGSASRIDSNVTSADADVAQVVDDASSNTRAASASSEPSMALLTEPADGSAFALPFEPGRLTATPILAAGQPFVAVTPVARPSGSSAFRAPPVIESRARFEEQRRRRLWMALGITQHSTAAFDAWTTRRVISNGYGYEMDPLLRPFAGNASLYAAIQVAPVALEYLGWRMMHSHHEWERRFWWMPQSLGAAMNLASGVHNLGVH